MTNTDDKAAIRARLESKLDEIVRRTGAVEKHLRGQDGRLSADFEDRVAFTEMDEVLEALDDAGRAEIGVLRSALGRLDDGTYGSCTSCGEDIGAARLAAIPEVALCIDCARAQE